MLGSLMKHSGPILTVVGETPIGLPTDQHFLTPNNALAWRILSDQSLYSFSQFPMKVKSVFLEVSFKMGGQHLAQGLETIGIENPIVPLILLSSLVSYHEKMKASGMKVYPDLFGDEVYLLREHPFEKNYLFLEGQVIVAFFKSNDSWLVDAYFTNQDMKLQSRGRVFCI